MRASSLGVNADAVDFLAPGITNGSAKSETFFIIFYFSYIHTVLGPSQCE